ncbi:hypothetical protein FB550_109179 [Neobacillus bataviensis]|uniref:DUF3953 domain-containing protein n=1 Tax=Neobacillus bataviensis TaxID=220685 RepID=A0A561D5F9_9BACI|nr:hypothetical protein [Neobacillus bataviensis]TWD98669.1 hypothetical protein FB550_109179 [Neobacillus bataviensis]
MKILSKLSIIFAILGILFISSAYIYSIYFEPLMVSGFSILFIGLLASFGAMYTKEQGNIKFLAVAAFFLLSFIVTWNQPFDILRLLTWIKN